MQDQKVIDELGDIPPDQTASGVLDSANSRFHDSGIGSTLFTTASTYAETAMPYGMDEERRVRVPPLPARANEWPELGADSVPTAKTVDALSLASSIVALVQLSASVYSAISKFYREVKDAKSKIGALATQTRNLSGVLQSLSLLASSPLFADAGVSVSYFRDTYIESCHNTLHEIKRILENAGDDFYRGRHTKLITGDLKWPFASGETDDLITELNQHRNVLQLALSAKTMSHLLQYLANKDKIATSADTLNRKLDRKERVDMRAELTAKREEIVRFFSKVNPEDQLQHCRTRRQPNTGKWLIERDQTFRNWMGLAGSQIWLSGKPGMNPPWAL